MLTMIEYAGEQKMILDQFESDGEQTNQPTMQLQ